MMTEQARPETFLERQQRLERERQGRTPAWLRRAQQGALYGLDERGEPVAKDTTSKIR